MTTTPTEPSPDSEDDESESADQTDRIEEEEWAQHQPAVEEPDNDAAQTPEDEGTA
jgi:hypothetical protein